MLPTDAELADLLDDACGRHGVPGAVAAVSAGGERRVAAAGIVRLPDGPPVTPSTLFLIGSITKVWTATLVMQLVDEGAIELDAPAQRYLEPRLVLGDQEVADTVTVRQLLTHTGGFKGDGDDPPDRGDDAVQRTVASYAALGQVHRPGRLFSYSNTGYTVLGRVIECVVGTTWDAALRERLIDPLGLRNASTLPEQTMVHPVGVGHETDAEGRPVRPVATWLSPRGSGPCGGTLATTADDLLAFGRLHIAEGRAPDGRALLSGDSARLMRTPQVPLQDPMLGAAWGLGWEIERLADPLVIGHSGSTDGQQARLLLVPERDLTVCMLTNGDPSTKARDEVLGTIVESVAGVRLTGTPGASADSVDPAVVQRAGGRYADGDVELVVTANEGGLLLRGSADSMEGFVPGEDTPLEFVGGHSFLLRLPALGLDATLTFVDENGDGGPPTHVVLVGQAVPRTG